MIRFGLILLSCALPLAAELESNTVTVTASRTLDAAFTEATIQLHVTAPPDLTLDQVSAVLPQFTFTQFFGSAWEFERVVPFTSLQSALAAVKALSLPGWTFDFNATAAPDSSGTACPYPALVSDARAQAQRLAALAGMSVGNLLGVAETPLGGFYFAAPTLAIRSGSFATATGGYGTFLLGSASAFFSPPPRITCSLDVKFALLRQ